MPTLMFQRGARQLAQTLRVLALGTGMLLSAAAGWAEVVGEVEFVRGVAFAQLGAQTPRIMGAGLPLHQGDRLLTSAGASVILRLEDGTRMTLRPDSDMLIQDYRFKENATDNSLVMQLTRGGFRAVTGKISKNSPDAAKIVTESATISVRGTDFDARLCQAECKAESGRVPEKSRANAVQASAKLVSAQGEIHALEGAGLRRLVVVGGSVYSGETVETGVGATAVLAFRDESRLTLGARARFRVDNYVFDEQKKEEGRSKLSLLRGSMRALTGLIGKADTRNVGFTAPTATIGIRGTGLDLDCDAMMTAADGGCSFFVWLGSIEVTQNGQTTPHVLEAGQGLFVSATEVRPLTAPTLQHLQRPDGVVVDFKQLFSSAPLDDAQQGLFVFVRDGHIEVTTERETLHLGRGETGYAADNGTTVRPLLTPLFMEFDSVLLPGSSHPLLLTVLNESGIRAANQCR